MRRRCVCGSNRRPGGAVRFSWGMLSSVMSQRVDPCFFSHLMNDISKLSAVQKRLNPNEIILPGAFIGSDIGSKKKNQKKKSTEDCNILIEIFLFFRDK